MVNVPAVRRVIASLKGELPETQNLGFNMGVYINTPIATQPDHSGRNCDWIACVSGHAYILEIGCPYQQARDEDPDEIEEIAQLYMGLSYEQANDLFFDLPVSLTLDWIPLDYVIGVLERLIVTGEVRWFEEEAYVQAA